MLAEFQYTKGMMSKGDIDGALALLRRSGQIWPFDHRFRSASAIALGSLAVQFDNPDLKALAVTEIEAALAKDPNSADLLVMALAFGKAGYQAQFDRIARAPLADYMAAQKAILARKMAAVAR